MGTKQSSRADVRTREREDNEKARPLVAVGPGLISRVASLVFARSWGHVFCVGDKAKDAEVNSP